MRSTRGPLFSVHPALALASKNAATSRWALKASRGISGCCRGGDSPTMPSGSIDPVTDGILVDIDDTAGTPQRITFCQGPHRDRVIRFLHAYTEVRRALAHGCNRSHACIPHIVVRVGVT